MAACSGSYRRPSVSRSRICLTRFLAVQTSNLDPLPHQIEAVYSKMLPRQPLRYLLADDPGAGKTIMAGLFCKELMIRGDVERCLIIAPGSLVEQWQDELWQKFGLSFEILTKDMIETARSGNPFAEKTAAHRPTRPPIAKRGSPSQARCDGLGPRRSRRGPQDVGPLRRRRDQRDQALQAWAPRRLCDSPFPPHDRNPARWHRGRLPPVPRSARRGPIRGQTTRRRCTLSIRPT